MVAHDVPENSTTFPPFRHPPHSGIRVLDGFGFVHPFLFLGAVIAIMWRVWRCWRHAYETPISRVYAELLDLLAAKWGGQGPLPGL